MNSLSLLKKAGLCLSVILLVSCQSLRTREDVKKSPTPGKTAPSVSTGTTTTGDFGQAPPPDGEDEAAPAPLPPPAPHIPSIPKIGLILGGGGAKTYAHIGFLHEIVKAKVPVQSIAGIEFAAPMGALYALREQANDAEWQMFKLKDDDVFKKSLLGSVNKNVEITALKEFLGNAFNRTKVEDFRIGFTCPSWNLKKNQTFMMNRGGLDQIMFTCMAYPPFFKPYQGNIAGVRDISATAAYLRSKGANYIVFVNVLQPPGTGKNYTWEASATDNVLWSEIAGLYNKPFAGVDMTISLDTSSYGTMDFDKRREIMAKGADSAAKQLKQLTRKWGL